MRQYFSLYRAVSQREGERGERIDESKNVQTTPTCTYCKRNRPLPYCNQNCRTPRHWKFTQDHRTTRPPHKCEKETLTENSYSNQNTRGKDINTEQSNESEKDTRTESTNQNKYEKNTKTENSDKKLSDKDTRTENCNKMTSERDTKKHNHDISEKDRSQTDEKDTKTENSTVNQNLSEKNSKTENSTTNITNKQKSETDTKTQNYNNHSVKPTKFYSINIESGIRPSERGASISVMDDLYLSDSDDTFTEDMEEFQISERDVDMDTEGYHRLIREVVKLNHREATPVVPIQKEQLCNPVLKKVVYQTFKFYQKTQEKRVLLNIGGKVFQTSRVTLKADPTSVFAVMFRRGCPFRPYARDTYYFDRDPSHFRFILNYLRNGGYLDIMTLPHEVRFRLEKERDFRASMYKKYRRGANVVDGIDTALSVTSVGLAASGVGLLSTIIAAPIALGLQVGAIVCGLLGAGGKLVDRRLQAKARKHDLIRGLAEPNLNTIADRISIALNDDKITEEEFRLILSEVDKSNQMKTEIRWRQKQSLSEDEKKKKKKKKKKKRDYFSVRETKR